MHRRIVPAVALTALLVLAGCAANPLNSASPSHESPPGVENGTLTNESALVDAHREGILSEGFIYRVNETFHEQGYSNETHQYRVKGAPGLQQYRVFIPESDVVTPAWGNGTGQWVYEERNSTTYYRFYNHTHLLVQQVVDLRGTGLTATDESVNFTVTDTIQRDGRDLTVLEANRTNRPAVSPRDIHIRLVVDSDGVVWEQRFRRYNERNEMRVLTRTTTYNLTQLGDVTVEKPDWLAEAVRHCSQPNASWSRCG